MFEQVAAVFAVIGGMYGLYALLRRTISSRPDEKALYIFAGTNELRERLLKLRGRTINFDTALDFSIGDSLSSRIADETEYRYLLDHAALPNGERLPLYVLTDHQQLDSFASLVVEPKQGRPMKFSHGGTGVIQVLLKGRFDVEVRGYSGPSVEITLREV
ncbi:MAG TPA: hypothetical protein VHW69_06610 [Rhizomicrobium sp.]|jgi:hypothetical protein|nr:hypothetical protein [Rhizomicrobium sp.]